MIYTHEISSPSFVVGYCLGYDISTVLDYLSSGHHKDVMLLFPTVVVCLQLE